MSRHAIIVWTLATDTHLLVRTPDADTGLVHAKKLAAEMGATTPIRVTTIILDTDPETSQIETSVIQDGTHQDVVQWVLNNQHPGNVGTVLALSE